MKIRLATVDDAEAISAVIRPLAEKFIAHEFSEEGARYLLDSLALESVREYLEGDYRFHVAEEDGGALVGVVGFRGSSHLYHLFVAERAGRRGIGRRLWEVGRQACVDAGHRGGFSVNASRFAVGMYEKLGFRRVGGEVTRNGVIAIPMRFGDSAEGPRW